MFLCQKMAFSLTENAANIPKTGFKTATCMHIGTQLFLTVSHLRIIAPCSTSVPTIVLSVHDCVGCSHSEMDWATIVYSLIITNTTKCSIFRSIIAISWRPFEDNTDAIKLIVPDMFADNQIPNTFVLRSVRTIQANLSYVHLNISNCL